MSNPQKKMCKVFTEFRMDRRPAREYPWAEAVGPGTARIRNAPFLTGEVAWDDLVKMGSEGKVLEVLERATRTVRATHEAAPDRRDAQQELSAIWEPRRRADVVCESAAPGLIGMAVPLSLPDARLVELLEQCPVPLEPEAPE